MSDQQELEERPNPNKGPRPWRWNKPRLLAIQLLVEGRLPMTKIALRCGVTDTALGEWRMRDEFKEKLKHAQQLFEEQVLSEGIANKAVRMAALNRLHNAHEIIMAERAASPVLASTHTEESGGGPIVPGGVTGLVVIQEKMAGYDDGKPVFREEAVFDATLSREYRATIQQAAEEMGHIVTKNELTGKDGKPLQVETSVTVFDELAQRVKDAKERAAKELAESGEESE